MVLRKLEVVLMFVQIPGFEMYLINQDGEIISMHWGKWKHKKLTVNKEGYLFSTFKRDDGKYVSMLVHRLVMLAFKGSSTLTVNHKDGIKTNNRLSNLEYCTDAENINHAWALGLCEKVRRSSQERANSGLFKTNKRESHYNARLTELDVKQIRELKPECTGKELADRFGISVSHVYNIWRGAKWS